MASFTPRTWSYRTVTPTLNRFNSFEISIFYSNPFQYLEKNNLLRTCREFLRECSELKLPQPTFLNGNAQSTFSKITFLIKVLLQRGSR